MGAYLMLIDPLYLGASSSLLFCTFTLSFLLILGQHSTGLEHQALCAAMEPQNQLKVPAPGHACISQGFVGTGRHWQGDTEGESYMST